MSQLLQSIHYLLQGLQNKTLASEAANALQNICSTCRGHMAEHFSGLLQILEQIDQFHLKPEAANGLIKGVVMIISIMTQEQVTDTIVSDSGECVTSGSCFSCVAQWRRCVCCWRL